MTSTDEELAGVQCEWNCPRVVAAGFGESTKPGKDGKLGKLLG